MVPKQLIVAVEGTAAIGPFWKTIVSDYLDKIVRCFCGDEAITSQKSSPPHVELSIVMFNAHGSYSGCLVQRSGWTSDMDIFFQWLSAIPFAGGGFNDVAIAEGLAEALMMFSSPNGSQNQNLEGQRHCILVAASNPYPLPTPVYRPQYQNLEKSSSVETQPENHLSDAETLAKFFAQCAISLSVICPKQLPKLRGIYNAGKCNPRAADPPVDNVKNPHFLILISKNFMEACSCLSRSGVACLPTNQNPVKADVTPGPPVSGPTSVASANGTVFMRPPVSVGNIPPATVKVEPVTVTSVTGPTFSHISSVPQVAAASLKTSSPISTSQDVTMISNKESVPDIKPLANNVTSSSRPVGPAANVRILNDVAQARQVLAGGTSIGVSSMGTPVLSNMISSGMPSSMPPNQTVISSGPTSISGPLPVPATAQVAQNSTPASYISAASNLSGSSSLPMSQPSSNVQNVSLSQTLPGISQGSLPATQMLHTGMTTSQNMRSGSGAASMPSGSGTMMPTPGISLQGQQGMQPAIVSSSSCVTNMPLNQQASSALQPSTKYVKMWEGNLSGQRQGQPVFITKLEGYRNSTSSDTLAANWPPTMQIVRLISQDHMNNKQHAGKGDYLVFRAVNQHGFLGQLQEKKLCAVIQLPSQTLLLSVSDKAHRLIGVLFPGDMVVFKPQIPNQLQQQQLQAQIQHQQQNLHQQQAAQMQQQQQNLHQQQVQMQQQQQNLHQQQAAQMQQQNLHHHRPQQQQPVQQLQQSPPLQQMQQQQQPHPQIQQRPLVQQQAQQQLATAGMNQAFIQGPGRSQLLPQGQTSSQGSTNLSGGSNFMG